MIVEEAGWCLQCRADLAGILEADCCIVVPFSATHSRDEWLPFRQPSETSACLTGRWHISRLRAF